MIKCNKILHAFYTILLVVEAEICLIYILNPPCSKSLGSPTLGRPQNVKKVDLNMSKPCENTKGALGMGQSRNNPLTRDYNTDIEPNTVPGATLATDKKGLYQLINLK